MKYNICSYLNIVWDGEELEENPPRWEEENAMKVPENKFRRRDGWESQPTKLRLEMQAENRNQEACEWQDGECRLYLIENKGDTLFRDHSHIVGLSLC